MHSPTGFKLILFTIWGLFLVLPFIKMAGISGKCSVDDDLLVYWLEKERNENGRVSLCVLRDFFFFFE